MQNLDLVILAGGKGSRIKKYLKNFPKPMAKFNKIYFLQYLINIYSKYPFKRIYILAGYKSDVIFKKFHNKISNFTKIICLKEKKFMGTGGALFGLKKKINNFVLVNGDTIFDIDIKDLVNLSKTSKKNNLGCIALTQKKKNINNYKLNNLSLKNNILIYKKKSSLMNGGIYFFKKELFKKLKNKPHSLEEDLLPYYINKKQLLGKSYNKFFLDIGTPKYFNVSSRKLRKYYYRPAAFLDRDGVINYDNGYVHKKKDFKFRKGVLKGLKFLIKKKYFIFIITNQAGIAKGYYDETDLKKLHTFIKYTLSKKNIYFDDIQYCPYHPKGKIKKFRKKSSLRKPNNQMIKNIYKNWLINKGKSFMIGDKLSDKLCAKKSMIKFSYAEKDFYKQVREIVSKT